MAAIEVRSVAIKRVDVERELCVGSGVAVGTKSGGGIQRHFMIYYYIFVLYSLPPIGSES